MSARHNEHGPCACPACSGQVYSETADTSLNDDRAPQMAPTYSNTQVIGQIASGAKWSGSQISYGFLQSSPSWDIGYEGDGFSAFTSYQAAATRNVMSMWDDVIAPSFVEHTSNQQYADVNFGNTTTSINYAHAYYPGNYNWAGEVWLNAATYNGLYSPDPGDYYFMTILHEVGHAIGLSHPGAYNGGSPTYANDAVYAQDTHQWTVMSYFNASNTGADWNGGGGWQYAQTPMVHDILAIQAIYGADPTTRAGDTTYGFNSNAGNAVYNFAVNSSPVLSIYDAGGTDTLDLSGFAQRAVINLQPGTYSSAGGTSSSMTYNIGIANGTWIENAIGGSGNDTIYGNSLDNQLFGGAGNDHLYGYDGSDTLSGGTGVDWAYFTHGVASYTIQVLQSAIKVIGSFVDTVLNDIEWLSFSGETTSYADLAAQYTYTSYTDGNDTVALPVNGGLHDFLGGDDHVSYTGGFVTIDGGSGVDTVDFSNFGSAVWAGLTSPQFEGWTRDTSHLKSGTWRKIADLTNVENLIGTAYDDYLGGDGQDNTFRYTEGFDTIDGYGGTDTVDFSTFGSAVWVKLNYTGTEGWTRDTSDLHSGTWRQIADLANVEDIIGTAHNDTLYGNASANTLIGGAGDDILSGNEGDDVIDGGAGTDTVVFANAIGAYGFGTSGTDILVTGATDGTDTVYDTVEMFQFSDTTISRANLISALTPPTLTAGADTATLPLFGGTFDTLGGDDHVSYTGGFVTIDGGSGVDTVDFSNFGSAVWAGLTSPQFEGWTRDTSHLKSGTWRKIADLTNVENLIGTAYDDYLGGDGQDNTFRYTEGFDTIDGYGGTDTVDFSTFGSAVWVKLNYTGTEGWTRDTSDLHSGTWRQIADLANVEDIIGTAHNDTLYGNASANTLIGGAGDDILSGNEGDDVIDGGAGTDTVVFANAIGAYGFGTSGTDILVTGATDGTDTVYDTVEMFQFSDTTISRANLISALTPPTLTAGADTATLPLFGGTFDTLGGDDHVSYTGGFVTIDGGSGVDTVDFSNFGSAVWAGLTSPQFEGWTRDTSHLKSGTWRKIADLTNVENLIGTAYDDYLGGDGQDNTFRYTEGFDTIDGYGGTDTVDFSTFGSAVWVKLNYTGTEGWTRDTSDLHSGTWRQIADLANVEDIIGTAHNDTLYGNASANTLIGGAGDDILSGNEGDDVIDGGAGTDTVVFANAIGAYGFGTSGTDILVTGATDGTDTVYDTVEMFQFSDTTISRANLISALTPPTLTAGADTATLPLFGGTFDTLGGDDHVSYTGGFVTIDGGSGVDTVDFSNFGSAVWAGLTSPQFEGWTRDTTHLKSGTWRKIADLTNVENLIGTAYDDYLGGDGQDNTFRYTEGFDTIDGYGGTDTVDFSTFGSAVWVKLNYTGTEGWTRDTSDLHSGTWRQIADLANVEDIIGTAHNDTLYGNASANTLIGGAGDDILSGNEGDDILAGDLGRDSLTGGTGADRFVLGDLSIEDLIADYSFVDGDVVDLTALFDVDSDGSTATTDDDSLSQFVRIVDNGDSTVDELQIDADGGGDNYSITAAVFDAGSMVRVVFQEDGADSTANVSV